MNLESVKIVSKVWGSEKWLVNNDKYCSKLLYINAGAMCSLHCHKLKQETFALLSGLIKLEVDGEIAIVSSKNPPVTILRLQVHRFSGIESSVLLEISTHHEDEDSYRIEESKS